MDTLLDILWEKIAACFAFSGDAFYAFLQSFHFFGPVVLIFLVAFATVCLTKVLKRYVVTKRYVELEKEYQYWFELRQETSRIEDDEIKKRMARNIDQAQLNKAYYDYFFEGFLLNVIRKVLPIFFAFAFINEYYRSERLGEVFNKAYLFAIPTSGGEQLLVGASFWFFISIIISYLLFALIGRFSFFTTSKNKLFSEKQSEVTQC
jgi:hypothetical protein